jgi:hypothetical protein
VSGALSIIPERISQLFFSIFVVFAMLVHIRTGKSRLFRTFFSFLFLPPSHHRWSRLPNAKVLPHVTFSNGIAMEDHICPP